MTPDPREAAVTDLAIHLHRKGVGCDGHRGDDSAVADVMHRDDAYDIYDHLAELSRELVARDRAVLAQAAPPPDDAWMEGRKQGKDRERTLEQENDLLRRQLAQAAPPPEGSLSEVHRLIERVLAASRSQGVQFGDGPDDIDTGSLASDILDVLPGAFLAQAAPPPRPPTEAEEYEALYEHPMPQAAPPSGLDVERLADVLHKTYGSVCPQADKYDWRSDAEYVIEQYAALRSPDTETAGEAG